MGTHLRVLSESYPMNTNMTGFRWFSKIFVSLCLMDESSLSFGRAKCLDDTDNAVWQRTIYLWSSQKKDINPSQASMLTQIVTG